ncbi:MAG: hypothetical protein H7A55_07675 [Verrucomicrobiaceae bacterium]|nr:hypothetical protein [Verrucomicrobiaceae bacterium]
MNKPRIITPLKPVTGPVISPIVRSGDGFVIRSGCTLPPISLISGMETPLKEAEYHLEYFKIQSGSTDVPGKQVQQTTCR